MNGALDTLWLLKGEPLVVNNQITVHHPTLNDICSFGEERYYRVAHAMTCTPSSYKVSLYDMGIDYETIDDFDFFCLMCKSLKEGDSTIFFRNIDFTSFEVMENSQTKERFLIDAITGTMLDYSAYDRITAFIRAINFFEKRIDKAVNADTKQYLIEAERRKISRQKKAPHASVLTPLISAMVNCTHFKYNYQTVWDLPIYAFQDSVQRIQKYKNYDQVMQGVYAGTVDASKLNMSNLSWLK